MGKADKNILAMEALQCGYGLFSYPKLIKAVPIVVRLDSKAESMNTMMVGSQLCLNWGCAKDPRTKFMIAR